MSKAHNRNSYLFSLISLMCLVLFNLFLISCGLDTVEAINWENVRVIQEPVCTSMEESENFFEFYNAQATYTGALHDIETEVYYKIYKSSEQLESQRRSILNSASRSSTAAFDDLYSNYQFKPLRVSGHTGDNSLFDSSHFGSTITIYLNSTSYFPDAKILSNSNSLYGGAEPVRINNQNFTFKRTPDLYIPTSEDLDTNLSGTGNDDVWYVSLFAIVVAKDDTYVSVYSEPLYLGSVKISVQD